MISESELNSAYKYCGQYAKSHYENFPVASLLFPKSKRKYIFSIYCFARIADDIADSGEYKPEEKILLLNQYEDYLKKSLDGNFNEIIKDYKSIFVALSNTVKTFNIPVEELIKLLSAFKQDATKNRYDNFDELIDYSDKSANPIGHLMLLISGYDMNEHSRMFYYSNKICTALQLTNFWQDVSIDLKINRIYIPVEIMKQHNYDENLLLERTENTDFSELITDLLTKTRKLFSEGEPLINELKGKLKLELKTIINGGSSILDKIEEINYNVLSARVKLKFNDKLRIFAKSII